MTDNHDETEAIRRTRFVEINASVGSLDTASERERLERHYGAVWDSTQPSVDFEVLGFMASYVVVRRKSDGRKGSLEFQHHPRLYFNFKLDR